VDEWHGTNAFIRDDGDRIFRTDFIDARGDGTMGCTWAYLDSGLWGEEAVRSHEGGWSRAFDNLDRALVVEDADPEGGRE
jgi:predicted dithiol-disulfide oxidoreductase (DUF899 family)